MIHGQTVCVGVTLKQAFLCVLKIRTLFSPVLFERVCILRLNVCVFDPSAAKLSQRPDAPH